MARRDNRHIPFLQRFSSCIRQRKTEKHVRPIPSRYQNSLINPWADPHRKRSREERLKYYYKNRRDCERPVCRPTGTRTVEYKRQDRQAESQKDKQTGWNRQTYMVRQRETQQETVMQAGWLERDLPDRPVRLTASKHMVHLLNQHTQHRKRETDSCFNQSPIHTNDTTAYSVALYSVIYIYTFYFGGAFQVTQGHLTESSIHSDTVIPVVVSYNCSHSCPGADWQKPGYQSAPTAPPTTTNIHSPTFIHIHTRCMF